MADEPTNLGSLSDDKLSAVLKRELDRIHDAEPREVLDIGGGEPVRAAFLDATKKYHPARFARRGRATQDLANEIFIRKKEAYDFLKTAPTPEPTQKTKTAARNEKSPLKSEPTEPVVRIRETRASAPARDRLRERRREELARKLGPSGQTSPKPPKRESSVASTVDPTEPKVKDPESEFRKALRHLEKGNVNEALTLFRTLAVDNPAETRYRQYMHYAWGRQRESEDRIEDAKAEYKRALGLDANFTLALGALANLENDKKAGFLAKIFRRS